MTDYIFKYILWERQILYFDWNCTELWFIVSTKNKLTLVQVLAWRRECDKPLPETTINDDIHWQIYMSSPGALAKKSCQAGKKCRKLKFPGKLLGCPLNNTVKSPQNPSGGNFYSRWPLSPLVAYCYILKSCKFLNSCHGMTILRCIPMFWKTKTQWNHYSNISLNPAGENPIWRPLQSEFYQRHQNVMQ